MESRISESLISESSISESLISEASISESSISESLISKSFILQRLILVELNAVFIFQSDLNFLVIHCNSRCAIKVGLLRPLLPLGWAFAEKLSIVHPSQSPRD